jgi:hypothetical protein
MGQAFTSARVAVPSPIINRRGGGKRPRAVRLGELYADLRGKEGSAKPPAGGDHCGHSRRAAAAEQIAMMPQLRFGRIFTRRLAFVPG